MSILNVAPADLVTSANSHHMLAAQLDTALNAAGPAVATMPTAYGPVGAAFIAAIGEFQVTLTATGSALVREYQNMSDTLHHASGLYAAVDEASGTRIEALKSHGRVGR